MDDVLFYVVRWKSLFLEWEGSGRGSLLIRLSEDGLLIGGSFVMVCIRF